MGQDITSKDKFIEREEFLKLAKVETDHLQQIFENNQLEKRDDHYGLELEGCLVDKQMRPAMLNEQFLTLSERKALVPELGKFNFEFNSPCYERDPDTFSKMLEDLHDLFDHSYQVANKLDLYPIWVGILPTLREEDLTLDSLTPRNRYFKLDEKLMELQHGKPIEIKIDRFDELKLSRHNIMTEAAATSLQIHTQVKPELATKAYNASLALAGPCTAIAANSPFLFGQKLWDETRITLFEQSVQIPELKNSSPVSLGNNYLNESVFELFQENTKDHIPVLPIKFDDAPEKLRHLKFLNGQVWRWIRPIIGVDYGEMSHIRLEQRSLPSGPSAADIVANTAFYIGLLHFYTNLSNDISQEMPFEVIRNNFYECSKMGMKAEIYWRGKLVNVQKLLHDELYEHAVLGLKDLNFSKNDIDYFLDHIMKQRIRTGWTGAAWQKSFMDNNGYDLQQMTAAYIENQRNQEPVIHWKV